MTTFCWILQIYTQCSCLVLIIGTSNKRSEASLKLSNKERDLTPFVLFVNIFIEWHVILNHLESVSVDFSNLLCMVVCVLNLQ